MQLIAFFLAGAFGLAFFADLASRIGVSEELAFTMDTLHAITALGLPATTLVWLGHSAEA